MVFDSFFATNSGMQILDIYLYLTILLFYIIWSIDCSCLENLDEIKDYPNYKFVKGNICSSELVSYVLEAEKIDTIMHFAAQTHVDNSFGNSFQFTQVCYDSNFFNWFWSIVSS